MCENCRNCGNNAKIEQDGFYGRMRNEQFINALQERISELKQLHQLETRNLRTQLGKLYAESKRLRKELQMLRRGAENDRKAAAVH